MIGAAIFRQPVPSASECWLTGGVVRFGRRCLRGRELYKLASLLKPQGLDVRMLATVMVETESMLLRGKK